MIILVTGGTGVLGTPTVSVLRAQGHDVRVLSRTRGDHIGDLTSGTGLADACAGADTVLHLATSAGAKDTRQTQHLVDAARAAGVTRIVYISIVGVDLVPYPYYRSKLASEQIIEASGIPFTILRATQFHSFIAMFIQLQKRLPVVISLDVPDQPIAAEEVAARLVELVEAGPSGHVADIGGPEHLRLREAIDLWQAAAGTHKRVWTLRLVGKTIRTFREGRHMTALPGFGRETFAEVCGAGGDSVRVLVRVGLGILTAVQLVTGLWQLLVPESFYRDFPTVSLAPPFNEHLMRDFGGANVALGIIVLATAVWMERRYVVLVLVLVAYLAFSTPHLLFHMTHLHDASPADIAFQVVSLGSAVALPLGVLAIVPRAFREAAPAE